MPSTSAPDRLETFRSIPMFAGLGDEALKRIVEIGTEFEAPAGQVLIERNREGSGMFVLEEGSVVVEHGSRRISLGPGQFFGEMALLTQDSTRAARVQAETHVRCLAISRNEFTKLLHDEPTIAVTMLGELAKRLADAMNA